MRIFVYFIVLILSITPIITHISEKNYIVAVLYGAFVILILKPFIKRFMSIDHYKKNNY